MKTIKTILIALGLIMVNTGLAQEFQGIATYKSHRQMNIEFDSTQVSSEMQQRMKAMMKKQFEKTYTLTFNKEESIYKEEEQLESPNPGGMQVVMVDTRGSDYLYKNTKEERYTNQNEVWGKVFLIKDKLEKRDWVLTNETKNIGDYTCYKATMTRQAEVVTGGISVTGDRDLDEMESTRTEEITVTAWYTPDIPINNGPASYQGLPGLILEINDGPLTLLCSRIVLNPEKTVTIQEPTKGKEVNQEKFDKIVEKKMKEMRERYNSERGDGHNVEIRIGG